MSLSRSHRVLIAGLGISVLVHAAAGTALVVSGVGASFAHDGDEMLATDMELAPDAPEAHDPTAEKAGPEDEPAAPVDEPDQADEPAEPDKPEAKSSGTIEPTLPDEPDEKQDQSDKKVAQNETPDAGVPEWDAGAVAANFDAGAGGPIAAGGLDAGVGDGGAGAQVVRTDPDAGPGDSVATGPADSDAPGATGPAPPGAAANLLNYFPKGAVVTIMVRLDRFRGTMWAPLMEGLFKPMPDYKAIIGSRKVSFSDLLESLVVSTPEPSDVNATTIVARYKLSAARARRFLNHREQPVRWSQARGGATGKRLGGKFVPADDKRVYMMPFANTFILAHPKNLGVLTQSSNTKLGAGYAAEAEMPGWLKRVRNIEKESGTGKDGPAMITTVQGLTGDVSIPLIGSFQGPERLTLSFEVKKRGWVIRGNMLFSDDAKATKFVTQWQDVQRKLTDTYRGKLMLAPFHAHHAVANLSLKRTGRKVAYATSVSNSDGVAMTKYATELLKIHFAEAWKKRKELLEKRKKMRERNKNKNNKNGSGSKGKPGSTGGPRRGGPGAPKNPKPKPGPPK